MSVVNKEYSMSQGEPTAPPEALSAVIVGAGFAGVGMAIRLKQQGIDSFVVLEREGKVGGVWRDNTYPGCACDVQSHLYSYSFEPNTSWTRMFAPQPEIASYIERCVDKYGIGPHLRLGDAMVRSEYDGASGLWNIRTASGKSYRARALVHAGGSFGKPAYPSIPGIERFQGKRFHSAHWDHAYPLEGKRVAVVGTGASAIQFVPAIQPKVAHLTLFQRTAPWILSKPDRAITGAERTLFSLAPLYQRLFRMFLFVMLEMRVLGFVSPKLMKRFEDIAIKHLHGQVSDPELRQKLTPTFTIGCKRILMSDNYYPSLAQSNAEVVTAEIVEARAHSLVTKDGHEHPCDAIIFGTGFAMAEVVPTGLFFGRGGRDLAQFEDGLPQAYKGTAFPGFPNFFMILGPNTGLGHSSMLLMMESQMKYILQAVKGLRSGWKSVEVKDSACRDYNARLAKKHAGAVWLSGCKSWYLDAKGRNYTLWPSFTFVFRRLLSKFDTAAYTIEIDTKTATHRPTAQPMAAALNAGSHS